SNGLCRRCGGRCTTSAAGSNRLPSAEITRSSRCLVRLWRYWTARISEACSANMGWYDHDSAPSGSDDTQCSDKGQQPDCISCSSPASAPNGCPRFNTGSVIEKAEMTQSALTKALIGWMLQETVQVAHYG